MIAQIVEKLVGFGAGLGFYFPDPNGHLFEVLTA